jgi:hypothetical protein
MSLSRIRRACRARRLIFKGARSTPYSIYRVSIER